MGSTKLVWSFFLLATAGNIFGLPANNKTLSRADQTDYILPDTIIPSKYVVQLKIEDKFWETKKFTGSIKITVDITKATKTIKLHSSNIIYLTTGISNDFTISQPDPILEMITLTYTNEIPKTENFVIDIPMFTGELRTEDMYGFYLSSYDVIDGTTKSTEWIATTQFQATHARKVFPCFDEPRFKAEFQISITRPAAFMTLGNTKIERTTKDSTNVFTDHFEITPKMSTYLIAFIVSKFKGYGATKTGSKDLIYDVFSRGEALPTAEYAYYVGQKVLNALNDYTDIKYYEMNAIKKMDQVAIPDFAAGAMENWGLVTYRETALLWDPKESTTSYQNRVATVIAHEFAHMWFGDLVTLQWWSYTWLNEGFARYFQYFITREAETTWELENQFVVEQQQAIFVSDSVPSALPLTSDVYTPREISNKFGSISYNKGACVIRMMNLMMGEENFKLGIREYLKTNQYKNTKPEDLWTGLKTQISAESGLPADFDVIMKTWTEESGFPLITIQMSGANAVLSQQQFFYDKDQSSTTKWYVPVTYTTSHEKKFSNEKIFWMKPNSDLTIENILHGGTGWIILNLKEISYYRVNYESALWDQLATGLKKENFDDIDVVNRAQIVDDVFNLARAGVVTYGRALDVTSYLENEVDYYPWYSAFSAFSYIRKRRGQRLFDLLERHIREMMAKLYENVSFDISNNDPHITVLKTALALQWACNVGIEACSENAIAIFKEYKDEGKRIDPNIRSVVYCSALRESKDKSDWEFLWNTFLDTTLASEQVTILNALGCTKDETILKDYLKKSITQDSGIRQQDARSVFNAVLSGNLNGVNVAYEFFKENIREMSEYYAGMNDLSNIISTMTDRFTTEEQIQDFEDFAEANKDLLKEGFEQVASAIENAKANIEWAQSELDDWLEAKYDTGTAITLSSPLLSTILLPIFIILFGSY